VKKRIRKFSTERWTKLGDLLERAHMQHPEFLSFQTAKAMCRALAAWGEIDKALANAKAAAEQKKETT
jgi:hypothetical protein